MPITFDTLQELKEFYRVFKLEEKAAKGITAATLPQIREEKPRRGRPAGYKVATVPKTEPAKRGRKPGIQKAMQEKKSMEKPVKLKRDKEGTLTSKIQATIRKFIDTKSTFTANDVYNDLAKRESDINKQSVITSVLKQMNSTFKDISVTERAGNGPRPVKLYNA
jgi:hypothetical protein